LSLAAENAWASASSTFRKPTASESYSSAVLLGQKHQLSESSTNTYWQVSGPPLVASAQ